MECMEPFKLSQALKELFQPLVAKAVPLQETVFRAVGTNYANTRDLLSGEGTKFYGGRWTSPGSFATVHASLDVETALAECLGTRQHYGVVLAERLPITLVAIDVQLHKLIDLIDESVLVALDMTRQRLLRCRWRESMEKGCEALTQAIGRIAFEEGLEGLLVPSAQVRKGKNLVVFPDNLYRRSSLSIRNAEKLPAIDG